MPTQGVSFSPWAAHKWLAHAKVMALDVQIAMDQLLLSAVCTTVRLCMQAMPASAHRSWLSSFVVVENAIVRIYSLSLLI
jgi:hypothetical protein